MAWKPTRREKILIWGHSGVGKTYNALAIMDFARATKTDSHFWIIDNNNQMEASGLVEGGEFEAVMDNATVWNPESFDEYEDITRTIKENASPEDWIIIDMLSDVYQGLPDWWSANVYGANPHTYWATVRKEIVDSARAQQEAGERVRGHEKQFGGTSGVDWAFIGKTYRFWEKQLSQFSPCHVLALSAEQEIEERWDKEGVRRALFVRTSGVAPKGEKDAVHRFHTTMRLANKIARDGKTVEGRKITVFRDRGRMDKWEELGGRGMTIELKHGPKFAWDYLVKVGGWKPAGG